MKEKLFRVKDGQLEVWLAWSEELTSRIDEVIATLAEEHVIRESATLFEVDGKHYVHMAMEFSGEPVSSNLERELNVTHREKLKQCLEPLSPGKQLYDFRR